MVFRAGGSGCGSRPAYRAAAAERLPARATNCWYRLPPGPYLCRMEFQKKKYTFRGMDGYAGFRNGQEYELELGLTAADDERPAEIVIINPVSRLWMHCSKQEFAVRWEKR
ncbi:hypothetical protein GCM10022407_15550 [Hymenobacter antarcticus]|uniref:DUF5060 domain-containing protein n=2 Tax=Hymenobacter antarcticus TaxID=486270 RepID=A0ABP7PSP5_9BACT